MYQGTCTNCEQMFEGRKRKFCSHECRQQFHNRLKIEKNRNRTGKRIGDYDRTPTVVRKRKARCRRCGSEFVRTAPNSQFCSPECRFPSQAKATVYQKICIMCEGRFTTKKEAKATCSNRCNMRLRYEQSPGSVAQRVREWEKRNPSNHRLRQGERTNRRRREVTGKVSTRDWLRALRKAEGHCSYCGEIAQLTIEHVVPLSRGGLHTIGNIVPACPSCNYQKKDRTVMEWRLWKEKRDARSRPRGERPQHPSAAK